MGVRDFGGLERGRSLLWISNHPRFHGSAWKVMLCISNHPRFHGSAWKVTALDTEPSTISWFSVEGLRSGYRTIHDLMVQRGRSPLWISNHPRYHGSAWKVLLGISNHPRFHGSAWKVLLGISNHPRFHGSAWKVPARKPSQSGRSEPTEELAQPALSSRMAYIPAALTPDLPSTHLVTQYPPIQDMRLKSKCLFIARYGYACRITIS